MENYKNQCMQNLPKQLTSVVLYTVKNMINSLCKKDSKRLKSLLEASPCGNKANNEFNKCNVGYIDKLLGTIHAEEKNRIPHICWYESRIYLISFICRKRISALLLNHFIEIFNRI